MVLSLTFMVCIENIVICVTQSKVICYGRLLCVLSILLFPSFVRRQGLQEVSLRIGRASCAKELANLAIIDFLNIVPRTIIFFSGNLLPLATLSNIDDHKSFFASELFGLSWSLDDDKCAYVDTLLLLLDAMEIVIAVWWRAVLVQSRWCSLTRF